MRVVAALMVALLGLTVIGTSTSAAPPDKAVVQLLAPTGKLRVALYEGAPATIIRGATPGDSKGVGHDLGKELARRIGLPFEPVVYPTAAAVMDGLKAGEWDMTILARSPERERIMDMTPPFLLIEQGFLVPPGSPIASVNDVDKAGVRIGAPQGGSINAVLSRSITNATVVPVQGLAAAPEALRSGKVDVFAANKANLHEVADKLPGARILVGRIGIDEYVIWIPKGREATLPYLRQFLDEARKEGVIKAAVQRVRLREAVDN